MNGMIPALLNCAIVTNDGLYNLRTISLEEVKALLGRENNEFISAIGHEATAGILTELLSVTVPVNRSQFKQAPKQDAVIFQLNSRIPEGKILNREEINQIGYSFKLLHRFGD